MEREVSITRIKQETPDTKTFRLGIKGEELSFAPGQFIMATAQIEGNPVARAFSISSSPLDDYVEITIKEEPNGYFSKFANNGIKEGDKFFIKGPYGHFTFTDKHKNMLLIAAGSGIAPMRSILRYICKKHQEIKVSLLYSNKKESDIIFREEFEDIENKNPNFKFVPTLTREDGEWKGRRGRINSEMLKEFLKDDSLCYACGSREMVEGVVKMLKEIGVHEERIKTEKYGSHE